MLEQKPERPRLTLSEVIEDNLAAFTSLPKPEQYKSLLMDMQSDLHGMDTGPTDANVTTSLLLDVPRVSSLVGEHDATLTRFCRASYALENAPEDSAGQTNWDAIGKYLPVMKQTWAKLMTELADHLPPKKRKFYEPDLH